MDPITQQIALACAGSAGAGDATYVDDVFSTFLYDGNGSTSHSINNGIDLSGEGGMVWFGRRDDGAYKPLFNTERGATKALYSNDSMSEDTASTDLTAFNSNGFTVAQGATVNANGGDYVSWTFRKAPGFFDVVTYTGNGTAGRTISHNLGSVPGFVMIKSTSHSTGWYCYHRSLGNDRYIRLDSSQGQSNSGFSNWNSTNPTSTEFTLGPSGWNVNESGYNYVAYLFAHDDQSFGDDSDEAIIKCDTYDGSGSAGNFVNVGFEPQWVLIKCISEARDWVIRDNMRVGKEIYPNLTDVDKNEPYFDFSANGFTLQDSSARHNKAGATYIYMAIRRPHKPPTDATEVFDDVAYTGNSSTQDISISPSIADSVLIKRRTAADNWGWANRLTGSLQHLTPNSSAAEATRAAADAVEFDRHNAFGLVGNSSGEVNYNGETLISYSFKRAPGFFDVVTYTGDGTFNESHVVNHNLGVAPEMIIAKNRDSSNNWNTYHTALTNSGYQIYLNNTSSQVNVAVDWNPTATTFTPQGSGSADSNSNSSGDDYIALLFATLPGISKVGSYTGTGSNIDVDCGFTTGARFVLIKQINAYSNWYVYDSARGIVSGNDTYLLLNTSGSETTPGDYIDPLNSGFTVTSSAPAALNASGNTYLFLAIA